MKTVHRSLVMGDEAPSVRLRTRRGALQPLACSSMKLPVPAAQTLFMMERVTRPSRRVVNFESWPPISMMVSTWGFKLHGRPGMGRDLVEDEIRPQDSSR